VKGRGARVQGVGGEAGVRGGKGGLLGRDAKLPKTECGSVGQARRPSRHAKQADARIAGHATVNDGALLAPSATLSLAVRARTVNL
jgi:hypothetical protein